MDNIAGISDLFNYEKRNKFAKLLLSGETDKVLKGEQPFKNPRIKRQTWT